MMANYEISVNGIVVAEMTADFAQASSPIFFCGDSTPYQVADARHNCREAAEMLLSWQWSQGGQVCEMTRDGQPVGKVTVAEVAATESD